MPREASEWDPYSVLATHVDKIAVLKWCLPFYQTFTKQALRGCIRGSRKRTTRRNRRAVPAEDLVRRDFAATAPDRLWTADITYVDTDEGFLYLAFILDAYSRKLVGWAMESYLRTELVVDALQMALWRRKPAAGLDR